MKIKMFSLIFINSLLVCLAIICMMGITSYSSLESNYVKNLKNTLSNSSNTIKILLSNDDGLKNIETICKELKSNLNIRTSIINSNGLVLYDSDADPKLMENHITRIEIKKAFQGEENFVKRYSNTIKSKLIYLAIPAGKLTDGSYEYCIRQSLPFSSLTEKKGIFALEIITYSLIAILFSAILSFILARKISRPLDQLARASVSISSGDFEADIANTNILEISNFGDALKNMSKDLKHKIKSLHKRNSELDEVFENMYECVFICASDGRVLRINKSCREIFDVKIFIRGMKIEEVFRNSKLLNAIEKTFETDSKYITDITIEADKEKTFSLIGSSLPYESKTPRALFVLHDISYIAINEKLRREFVTNISHELKTPVTSIKMAGEALFDSHEQFEKERFLSIIDKETDRINTLVNDMLLLSKIEYSENLGKENFEYINLKSVIEESISIHENESKLNEDSIILDCPDIQIHGDFTLLQMAFSNLIGNAIKYAGKKCEIKIIAKEIKDGKISIEVSDNGIGISKEHLPRIFERFYRVDKGRSRAMGGTGLGLAIVKHVTMMHGGNISVESHGGTKFTITLLKGKNV